MALKKIVPIKRKDLAKNLMLFQTRVDKELYHRLRLKLVKEEIYIQDFVDAAIKNYLEQK